MADLSKFVAERNEALFSLDKKKILAFAKKYGIAIPENDVSLWAGVHKAILHINGASHKQKAESIAWLLEHGFSTEIGG